MKTITVKQLYKDIFGHSEATTAQGVYDYFLKDFSPQEIEDAIGDVKSIKRKLKAGAEIKDFFRVMYPPASYTPTLF